MKEEKRRNRMTQKSSNKQSGFSLIEMMIALAIVLILMGAATTLIGGAFSTRARETRRTEALVAAQAALDSMSREIANSGFGLKENGIIGADSNSSRIHFRTNIENRNLTTNDPGEDVAYYFDNTTQSILRYDKCPDDDSVIPANLPNTPCPDISAKTTIVVNRISNVSFQYFNYTGNNSAFTAVTTPDKNTGRVRITITIEMEAVQGQPNNVSNRTITLTSDVNLRNSTYMKNQY